MLLRFTALQRLEMTPGGLPLSSELSELTFVATLPTLQHLTVSSSYKLIN